MDGNIINQTSGKVNQFYYPAPIAFNAAANGSE